MNNKEKKMEEKGLFESVLREMTKEEREEDDRANAAMGVQVIKDNMERILNDVADMKLSSKMRRELCRHVQIAFINGASYCAPPCKNNSSDARSFATEFMRPILSKLA